eukprot:TRINITY_DN33055_c0_g1_i1.p2 TRINITY_DN33055_c0_g1~~TRINITY_DN33055_c0_g1_i1.p2  ORF type:complete len:328 (+),score=102.63 TRINITY_DN33055_c0_g1_i1:57-1040(+)
MRVTLYWCDNDTTGTLEEDDAILNAESTIRDIKGLIKLASGESMRRQIILMEGEVCGNETTLSEWGVDSQEAADARPFTLVIEDGEEDHDDPFAMTGEMSHEQYIRAQRAMGMRASVTQETEHQEMLRREAIAQRVKPRARPSALLASMPDPDPAPPTPANPHLVTTDTSQVYQTFIKGKYGMRVEGVEEKLKVRTGPGKDDEYEYWDLRLVEDTSLRGRCDRSCEIVLEIFYFGEIKKCGSHERFKDLILKALARYGFEPEFLRTADLRDAGCMYPLIAVPIVMSHREADRLGHMVFEHFGRPMQPPAPSANAGAASNKGGGCGTQ